MAKEEKKENSGGLNKYFRGVRAELKKVIWPTKEETLKYSALVIVLSIISALVIYLFDFIIHGILQLIIG